MLGLNVMSLKELTDLVGSAADSIKKFADAIKYCASSGVAGYDYISAKREMKRLKEISAQATEFRYCSQSTLYNDIDSYLKHPNPESAEWKPQWNVIKKDISNVIERIKSLLDDVKKERSDFILEEDYKKLIFSMSSRISLLERMRKIPSPKTNEELEELKKLNREYKRLLNNFSDAIDQLNQYLKDKENNDSSN
jgi:hypothetical protein